MSKDCRVAYDITDYLCRHGAEVGTARAVILGAYNGLKIRVFAEAFQHLYVIDDGNSDSRCTEPVLGETSNEVIEAMDWKLLQKFYLTVEAWLDFRRQHTGTVFMQPVIPEGDNAGE